MLEVLVLSTLIVVFLIGFLLSRFFSTSRVRVVPMSSTPLGNGVFRKSPDESAVGSSPCILIENESDRPIEIKSVRFSMVYPGLEVSGKFKDGKTLPRVLQPNESVTMYFAERDLEGVPRVAVVELSDGQVFRGKSPALKHLRQRLEHRRLARLSSRRVKVA